MAIATIRCPKQRRGRVSDPAQAALSGSHRKAQALPGAIYKNILQRQFAGLGLHPRNVNLGAVGLPHRQSHFIHPFVKWSTGGILVQLILDTDHILPSGSVDRPSLI